MSVSQVAESPSKMIGDNVPQYRAHSLYAKCQRCADVVRQALPLDWHPYFPWPCRSFQTSTQSLLFFLHCAPPNGEKVLGTSLGGLIAHPAPPTSADEQKTVFKTGFNPWIALFFFSAKLALKCQLLRTRKKFEKRTRMCAMTARMSFHWSRDILKMLFRGQISEMLLLSSIEHLN